MQWRKLPGAAESVVRRAIAAPGDPSGRRVGITPWDLSGKHHQRADQHDSADKDHRKEAGGDTGVCVYGPLHGHLYRDAR